MESLRDFLSQSLNLERFFVCENVKTRDIMIDTFVVGMGVPFTQR